MMSAVHEAVVINSVTKVHWPLSPGFVSTGRASHRLCAGDWQGARQLRRGDCNIACPGLHAEACQSNNRFKTRSCLFIRINCPDMWLSELNGVQASLQQRLIERKLTDAEIDQLSVMSMSGVAAEAQTYEEVSAARL
jgi:hypothetical protein